MRIGVIDLGTNTFNLLIAELNKEQLNILYSDEAPVMLGEKTIQHNIISPPAIERAIQRLLIYKKLCAQHGVKDIYALGTSAIREAENKNEFIAHVLKETGISITVIDGSREAALICRGVHCKNNFHGNTLILDIGGGSNEYILKENGKFIFSRSYKQGATRLKSMFSPSDPITTDQIMLIEEFLTEQIGSLFEISKRHPVDSLIGSAGNFMSLSAILNNGVEQKHGYEFNMNDYFKLHQFLIKSTHTERRQLPGLPAMRVDLVVVASIIVNFILSKLQIKRMYLSEYALKEGFAYEKLKGIDHA